MKTQQFNPSHISEGKKFITNDCDTVSSVIKINADTYRVFLTGNSVSYNVRIGYLVDSKGNTITEHPDLGICTLNN